MSLQTIKFCDPARRVEADGSTGGLLDRMVCVSTYSALTGSYRHAASEPIGIAGQFRLWQ